MNIRSELSFMVEEGVHLCWWVLHQVQGGIFLHVFSGAAVFHTDARKSGWNRGEMERWGITTQPTILSTSFL